MRLLMFFILSWTLIAKEVTAQIYLGASGNISISGGAISMKNTESIKSGFTEGGLGFSGYVDAMVNFKVGFGVTHTRTRLLLDEDSRSEFGRSFGEYLQNNYSFLVPGEYQIPKWWVSYTAGGLLLRQVEWTGWDTHFKLMGGILNLERDNFSVLEQQRGFTREINGTNGMGWMVLLGIQSIWTYKLTHYKASLDLVYGEASVNFGASEENVSVFMIQLKLLGIGLTLKQNDD